jgi:Putative auto-transporter adhesin, head GIN domain
MRQRAIRWGGALVLLLATVACGTVASGNIVSETRELDGFDRIEVANGLAVDISVDQDANSSLTSTYDDNLQDHIKTEVEDGVLTIEIEGGVVGVGSDRVVEVVLPRLSSLMVSGGSVVHGRGATESIELEVEGGAIVDLSDLIVQTMNVDVSAGSRAAVTAEAGISGDVSGGASLEIGGNPASRAVETSGGGRVTG